MRKPFHWPMMYSLVLVAYSLLASEPNAPTDIAANYTYSEKQINLTWIDCSSNEDGFVISRKEPSDADYQQIAIVNANTQQFSDSSVECAKIYQYKVASYNLDGESSSTSQELVTPNGGPLTPLISMGTSTGSITATSVYVIANSGSYANWEAILETEFVIERSLAGANDFLIIASSSTAGLGYYYSVNDCDLQPSTTYTYRARAFNAWGESSSSFDATTNIVVSGPGVSFSISMETQICGYMTWHAADVPGAVGVRILRDGSSIYESYDINGSTYDWTAGYATEHTYTLEVLGYNMLGYLDAIASGTTTAIAQFIPPALTNVWADASAQTSGVFFSWTDTIDPPNGVKIYRKTIGLDYQEVGAVSYYYGQSWWDQNVNPGTTYQYRLVCYNNFDESAPWDIEIYIQPLLPSVKFSQTYSSGPEAATVVDILVELSFQYSQEATVDYTVTGGTAQSGESDYYNCSGTLVFEPNETLKTIRLYVKDDSVLEPHESVIISLFGGNITLGNDITYDYLIINDDSYTDVVAPTIFGCWPLDASNLSDAWTITGASFLDDGSGINTDSLVLRIDGVAVNASVEGDSVIFIPSTAWNSGSHVIEVSISDNAGNISTSTWSFTLNELFVLTVTPTYGQFPLQWQATATFDGANLSGVADFYWIINDAVFYPGASLSIQSHMLIPGFNHIKSICYFDGKTEIATNLIFNYDGSTEDGETGVEQVPDSGTLPGIPIPGPNGVPYAGQTFYILVGYCGDSRVNDSSNTLVANTEEYWHWQTKHMVSRAESWAHESLSVISDIGSDEGTLFHQQLIDDELDSVTGHSSAVRLIIDRNTTYSDLAKYLSRPDTVGIAFVGHGWFEPKPDAQGEENLTLEHRFYTAVKNKPWKGETKVFVSELKEKLKSLNNPLDVFVNYSCGSGGVGSVDWHRHAPLAVQERVKAAWHAKTGKDGLPENKDLKFVTCKGFPEEGIVLKDDFYAPSGYGTFQLLNPVTIPMLKDAIEGRTGYRPEGH